MVWYLSLVCILGSSMLILRRCCYPLKATLASFRPVPSGVSCGLRPGTALDVLLFLVAHNLGIFRPDYAPLSIYLLVLACHRNPSFVLTAKSYTCLISLFAPFQDVSNQLRQMLLLSMVVSFSLLGAFVLSPCWREIVEDVRYRWLLFLPRLSVLCPLSAVAGFLYLATPLLVLSSQLS